MQSGRTRTRVGVQGAYPAQVERGTTAVSTPTAQASPGSSGLQIRSGASGSTRSDKPLDSQPGKFHIIELYIQRDRARLTNDASEFAVESV